jgi:iron complex transport system ATP-binding protein
VPGSKKIRGQRPAGFPLFDFRRVTVLRQGKTALKDLTLRVSVGEHLVILGPNGSGKSTLIKCITRELYPLALPGYVFRILGGETWNVFELRKHLGIVTPDWLAHPTRELPARDVVLSGFFAGKSLWSGQRVTEAMERKTSEVLEFLGVSHLAGRSVLAMSSGEQRRVLLGRALVHDPLALILDEPTNSLDPRAVRDFRAILRTLAQAGTTIILVTHHLSDIIPEIGRAVLIKNGVIAADGPTKMLLASEPLSRLFGLRAHVEKRRGFYHLTA